MSGRCYCENGAKIAAFNRRQAAEKRSKRAKKWYDPPEYPEEITHGAVIISGMVVGQARTAKEREWFVWAFGE
jgi:hypothetical protein